jgi:hypothetical protein
VRRGFISDQNGFSRPDPGIFTCDKKSLGKITPSGKSVKQKQDFFRFPLSFGQGILSKGHGLSQFSFTQRFFQISPAEIGFLRFLLESYDGLGFVRTLDPRRALVEISFPPSRQRDVAPLLAALAAECGMVEVPSPSLTLIPSF